MSTETADVIAADPVDAGLQVLHVAALHSLLLKVTRQELTPQPLRQSLHLQSDVTAELLQQLLNSDAATSQQSHDSVNGRHTCTS